jgi:hypothetical protein
VVRSAAAVAVIEPLTLEAGSYWLQGVVSETVEIGVGVDELVTYRKLYFDSYFQDSYGLDWDYEGPRHAFFMSGEIPD